jgi:hypothetical protein
MHLKTHHATLTLENVHMYMLFKWQVYVAMKCKYSRYLAVIPEAIPRSHGHGKPPTLASVV